MVQTFEIPGRMDGLNEYTAACRTHRQVGGKLKRKNQDMAERAIRASRLVPMRRRVDVELVWVEPNMRRDKDNIRFAVKFILDALVACGVLADDGWPEIGTISDRYAVNKKNPRIIVTLDDGADEAR